jgi:nitroreductase
MAIDITRRWPTGSGITKRKGTGYGAIRPTTFVRKPVHRILLLVPPLNLVYVAHGERMGEVNAEDKRLYASVDAGFIGQNVYLFCASEGLGTVFRGARL